MDNPGTSIFHDVDIQINNSQNNEEEEDLQDRLRRKEELNHLISAELGDFNYDDSTINSSTNVSLMSNDDIQNNYRAAAPDEQLKVLYEVRVREINKLKTEYENYKVDKTKEVDSLKNKLTLAEADIRQLQTSLKNSESLLAEKTEKIKCLQLSLSTKEDEMKQYKSIKEELEVDVNNFRSKINELQLKLQAENHPFNLGARIFKSEELQRAHQEQIHKLESLLDEQTKKCETYLKEKEELKKFVEQKTADLEDNKSVIDSLSNSLESAQKQCQDFLNVIEALTKENDHFKERVQSSNAGELTAQVDGLTRQPKDIDTLVGHVEKLKKMLVDKAVELSSLQMKFKFYESDYKELLEYRKLKNDVYMEMTKMDFRQCGNIEHSRNLLLMHNDIQNYKKILEDKETQIANLTTINKELQEKIEDMLLQTRNDIQNLSHKYSLPQLEVMSKDLELAELKINELEEKLKTTENEKEYLIKKINKEESNLLKEKLQKAEQELGAVKKELEEERNNFKSMRNEMQKNLDQCDSDIFKLQQKVAGLKQIEYELRQEIAKLNQDLQTAEMKLKNQDGKIDKNVEAEVEDVKKITNQYQQIKDQLNQVMTHLQKNKQDTSLDKEDERNDCKSRADEDLKLELQSVKEKHKNAETEITNLKETLEELNNAKTIAEAEMYSLNFQLKDTQGQLEQMKNALNILKNELLKQKSESDRKDEIIKRLKENCNEIQMLKDEIQKLQRAILEKENAIKMFQEDKTDLSDILQQTQKELGDAKKEILRLQQDLSEESNKIVRRNLENELKEAEQELHQSKVDENIIESDHFKKCLQAELLKTELSIRTQIQSEFANKIKEIEKKYHLLYKESQDINKNQMEKMGAQEARWRDHLAAVLSECAQNMTGLENDNKNLKKQISLLQQEYDSYKKQAIADNKEYHSLLKKTQLESQKQVESWKAWCKQFVSNSLHIEGINKNARDKICIGMANYDAQVSAVEKAYNDKIKLCFKDS